MKNKCPMLRRLLCLFIGFTIFSSVFIALQQPAIVWAQGTELKILNPVTGDGNFTFSKDTTNVGDTFIANITVFNIINMTAWQLNVTFDPTMIRVLDIFVPADDVFKGKSTFEGAKDINNAAGYVLWWVALGIGATPVNVTEGRMCQIRFNITTAPPTGGTISCPIHIVMAGETDFYTKLNAYIGGMTIEESFISTDGEYEYAWLLQEPVLKVEPETHTATRLGQTFQINVTINDLVADWRVIGVEFKLRYHPDLLKAINVDEGPFMKQFPTPPNTQDNATLFMWYDEYNETGENFLLCGILLWPNMSDTPTWTVFPEGNGVLATITLKTIKLPAECTLELFETKIITDAMIEVPHSVTEGFFDFPWEILTHEIEIFTQTFEVLTVSNGSITPIPMTFDLEHRLLTFNVAGESSTLCLVNITIPRELIDATEDDWLVLVGGQSITPTIVPINDTHVLLSLQFSLSTKSVYIIGTWIIPEYTAGSMLIFLLLATFALTSLAYSKRKKFPLLK